MRAWVAILIMGMMLGSNLSEAIQPPPKQARAVIPVGRVSAAEAIQRIEAHMKTLDDKRTAMDALYNRSGAFQTITAAYQRNGANQWATDQYTGSAGDGLYLTWDVVSQFYSEHYNALKDSLWDIQHNNQKTVATEKLTYLDQGMAAWLSKEKEVQVRMQHITDNKGKIGAASGRAHELWDRRNDSTFAHQQYEDANAQYYHLGSIDDILVKAVREIGYKTRLFSATTQPAAFYENYMRTSDHLPVKADFQAAPTHQVSDLSGDWQGWGTVKIDKNKGTYTDTFGGNPGWLELTPTALRQYRGRWGEPGRSGTMEVTVNEAGTQARVQWKADPNSQVGPIDGGVSTWQRRQPETAHSQPKECSFQPVPNRNKPTLQSYAPFKNAHWQLGGD